MPGQKAYFGALPSSPGSVVTQLCARNGSKCFACISSSHPHIPLSPFHMGKSRHAAIRWWTQAAYLQDPHPNHHKTLPLLEPGFTLRWG